MEWKAESVNMAVHGDGAHRYRPPRFHSRLHATTSAANQRRTATATVDRGWQKAAAVRGLAARSTRAAGTFYRSATGRVV
jgi:hypothetical protein